MAKIQLIVGTTKGQALRIAAVVAKVAGHLGHQVRINPAPEAKDLIDDPDEMLLVCCSTTGNGELPRNIYPVFLALDDRAVDVAGRLFGVIALGDSNYRQFAQAGYQMESVFYAAGARRVGEVFTLDAGKEPNQPLAAASWLPDWLALLPETT